MEKIKFLKDLILKNCLYLEYRKKELSNEDLKLSNNCILKIAWINISNCIHADRLLMKKIKSLGLNYYKSLTMITHRRK